MGNIITFLFAMITEPNSAASATQKEDSCGSGIRAEGNFLLLICPPPAILQSDNGREFHNAAPDNSAKKLNLDDDFILAVVKEARLFG